MLQIVHVRLSALVQLLELLQKEEKEMQLLFGFVFLGDVSAGLNVSMSERCLCVRVRWFVFPFFYQQDAPVLNHHCV